MDGFFVGAERVGDASSIGIDLVFSTCSGDGLAFGELTTELAYNPAGAHPDRTKQTAHNSPTMTAGFFVFINSLLFFPSHFSYRMHLLIQAAHQNNLQPFSGIL
jgi:hypothetical protein